MYKPLLAAATILALGAAQARSAGQAESVGGLSPAERLMPLSAPRLLDVDARDDRLRIGVIAASFTEDIEYNNVTQAPTAAPLSADTSGLIRPASSTGGEAQVVRADQQQQQSDGSVAPPTGAAQTEPVASSPPVSVPSGTDLVAASPQFLTPAVPQEPGAPGVSRDAGSQADWAFPGCHHNPHYFRGEYLMWWLTGDHVPALVTTSPTGTPINDAGNLGAAGTSILFGDQSVNTQGRSGARLTLGLWLNPSSRVELEWFGLGNVRTSFNQNSTGAPILAVPFFNLSTSAADAYVLAYPGAASGGIVFRENSFFNGAGFHVMRDFWNERTAGGGLHRFGGLYGFRYLGLYEKFDIDSITTGLGGSSTFDGFRTSNNFYGGNFGLFGERYSGRWTWATIGRLAFGSTTQHANITGVSTAASPAFPTGLFALPSNMGSYGRELFTVLPQLELKCSFALSPRWRLTAGYDLLYWNRVARPGQQIDASLNQTQLSGVTTGTPGPMFKFVESELLIQGVSCGAELRY